MRLRRGLPGFLGRFPSTLKAVLMALVRSKWSLVVGRSLELSGSWSQFA